MIHTIALEEGTWLNDHRVFGSVVYPAAGFIHLAHAAAVETLGDAAEIRDVRFQQPLFLSTRLRIEVQADVDASSQLEIRSRAREGLPWIRNVVGRVEVSGRDTQPLLEIDAIQQRCRAASTEALYAVFAGSGVEYGPAFRRVGALWCGAGEALGRIDASGEEGCLYPPVLDAALQVVLGAALEGNAAAGLPASIEAISFAQPLTGGPAFSHARIVFREGKAVRADVRIGDPLGRTLVEIRGLNCVSLAAGR